MRKHLILTCLAYMVWGAGITIAMFGRKTGLPLYWPSVILALCMIFFLVVTFTSLQKIKEKLFEDEYKEVDDEVLP